MRFSGKGALEHLRVVAGPSSREDEICLHKKTN